MGDNLSEPFDDNRTADFVIVPDVVGLRFLEARDVANAAGVSVANPDPDGPPIGAIVWPTNPAVARQHPAPGTVLHRWDSLRVWLLTDLEPDMARKLDVPPPSVDSAHSTPDRPIEVTDITGEESTEGPR
ncbi:MAG TPA: PASTA domain-containing protein [Microbacteriaceae bacterium]